MKEQNADMTILTVCIANISTVTDNGLTNFATTQLASEMKFRKQSHCHINIVYHCKLLILSAPLQAGIFKSDTRQ